MNCHEFEELVVDALYGELDRDAKIRFNAHIDSCTACERVYAEMRSTLHVMDQRKRPDPGQAYWDGYWNRLASRMEREGSARKSEGWLGRLFPGLSTTGLRWAYRGALAVLFIVFGAVVGRIVLPGNQTDTTSQPNIAVAPAVEPGAGNSGVPVAQSASAEACARQYIEDTQVLLLALVNFDPATESEYLADWSAQKNRSQELATQAASFKGDLNNPKQRRLRNLVTELEAILLQIANLETTGDLESVELIRSSVEDRNVMLKINLEKINSADEERPAPGTCDA